MAEKRGRPKHPVRWPRRITKLLERILGLSDFGSLNHQALTIGTSRGPALLDPGGGKQRTHDFFRRHAVSWGIRRLKMGKKRRRRGRIHLARHVFRLEIAKPPQQALYGRHFLRAKI